MAREPDPQLRRIERSAVISCGIVAAVAGLAGGGWRGVLAVVGGALLVGVSWSAVRDGVDAAIEAGSRDADTRGGPSMLWRAARFLGRFAILALLAYVMMVRLRAQPWWMLAGATAVVAAPAFEVLRLLRARS